MNWKERNKEHYCKTPAGEFVIKYDHNTYDVYLEDECIAVKWDLELAKEEAITHLKVLYYKLKMYLELDEE